MFTPNSHKELSRAPAPLTFGHDAATSASFIGRLYHGKGPESETTSGRSLTDHIAYILAAFMLWAVTDFVFPIANPSDAGCRSAYDDKHPDSLKQQPLPAAIKDWVGQTMTRRMTPNGQWSSAHIVFVARQRKNPTK